MTGALDWLSGLPLDADGPFTRMFKAAGVGDFAGAARHLLALPYGRISDRAAAGSS